MKSAFNVVVYVLLLSVLVTACSSTPAAMPTGEWEGKIGTGNSDLPILVTFNDSCAKGEVCATVLYENLNCESSLTFRRTKGEEMVFEEAITYGNFCKDGRTLYIKYVDDQTPITLRYVEQDGDDGPSGSISHGRIPLPTQPPISIPGFGREVFSWQNMGLFINWRGVLADGSLWLPDSHSGNLIRINTSTNQIVATIKVGDPESSRADGYDPNGVAVSGDIVWVTQRAERSIGRIDPVTNTLVETIKLPNIPYDLIIDGNALWVTSFEGDVVMRVDLDTKEIYSIYVNKPLGIVAGGGAIWAVEHRNGNLVRINPQTNEVVARIDLSLPPPNPGAQPEEVIFAEGSVWVANNGGRTVSRVDAVTNEILATTQFDRGFKPMRLTAGGGFVWVSLREEVGSNVGDAIAQIDPATNAVVKTTPFRYVSFIIYDNGTLWIGDYYGDNDKRAGDRILRIELSE